MKRLSSIILFFCLCQFSINAQSPIEENHPSDLVKMDKDIKLYSRRADTFGGLALAGLAGSVLALSNLGDGDSPHHGRLFLGLGAGFLACISGSAGLIYKAKESSLQNKRKKSLETGPQGFVPEKPELYIGMVDFGLGLVLTF